MTGADASSVPTASSLIISERWRGLEAGWLATLVAVSGAIGLSWFLRTIDLDVSFVLRSIFVCALGALVTDVALEHLENRFGYRLALELGHAIKIVWLGVLWHLLGGIDNPMVLLAFFLPLLTAGVFLRRHQVLVTAGWSVAVVAVIALVESPELRWYLLQLGLPLESLVSLLPEQAPGRARPFSSLEVGPEFQFVVLLIFTLLLFAAALLSSLFATRGLALVERFRTASWAQDESAADLFRSALREDPIPTVLVYADSGQIVEASRSFTNQMLLAREGLAGKTLFDCLSFSDPQSVRALLARQSGELPFSSYRVGTESRTARVRCYRIQAGRTTYASVSVLDLNELSYLAKVSDGLEEAILIIRDDREVAYFNAAASRLCPGLHFGMDAERFLDTPGSLPQWWTPDREAEISVTIQRRVFQVRSIRVKADGGSETLVLARLSAADRLVVPLGHEARAS